MLSVSSSKLSDAGVRPTGRLRRNMGTQIPECTFLIHITTPSLSPLKWGGSISEIQPVWWRLKLLPGSFPTLLKLLKPKWGFFKHPTAELEVKLVVGVQRWLAFQVERAPHKIYLKLSSIKTLVWGGGSDLHTQTTQFLYLLLPEEFQNQASVSPGSVITTGLQAGAWTEVFSWHLPTPLCVRDFEVCYFTGRERQSNLGTTSLT